MPECSNNSYINVIQEDEKQDAPQQLIYSISNSAHIGCIYKFISTTIAVSPHNTSTDKSSFVLLHFLHGIKPTVTLVIDSFMCKSNIYLKKSKRLIIFIVKSRINVTFQPTQAIFYAWHKLCIDCIFSFSTPRFELFYVKNIGRLSYYWLADFSGSWWS